MSYRGDDDAQRARIVELERELDAARAQIATLRGEAPGSAPGTTLEQSRVSGGPSRYVREVTLPHAITETGYEAIAKVLRERLGKNASQVGRTLTVPGTFALTREGDGVRLRLEADWRTAAGGVLASGGLAGGFGGLVSAGLLADVLNHGLGWHHTFAVDAGLTATVLALATTFTAAAAFATRRRTARGTREALAKYEGTFEAILALAAEHALREVPPTRVVADAGVESEADLDAPEPAAAGAAPARSRVE